jgi:predicted ATPase
VSRTALCPVLIRRDDELGVLEEALLAARRGESRFVVLAGEAGIGKTRLSRELACEARELGCAVLCGGASDTEVSLPYLPFVEAIGNYIAVTGETTNLAACLQAQAGPGEILLSAEAHRRVADWLVDHGLEATEEELELKGFADPQAVHRIPAHSAVGMASR